MALYIKPDPINKHNLIRWHEAVDLNSDSDRVEGFTRCGAFESCCDDFFVLPARPDDFVAGVINGFTEIYLHDASGPDGWGLGYITCCGQVQEMDYLLTGYKADGSAAVPGEWFTLKYSLTVPEIPLGTRFNLCIYRLSDNEPLFVSNPFEIIPEEVAKCDTLIMWARPISGEEITQAWTEEGERPYFPAGAETEIRIKGSLSMVPVKTFQSYTLTNGQRRRRNDVQTREYTLETYGMDEEAHEAMSLYMSWPLVSFYKHDYQSQLKLVPYGEYSANEPSVNTCLSNGEAKLQPTDAYLSFRTC